MLKLHSYFRSSAAYRCRIALNLKGLEHETAFVHLIKDGGQHNAPAYRALNPQGLVPALEIEGGVLTQSPAILEWIDERWPEPPLLPPDAFARAEVRAMAATVACDIHPLNNLRVLKALRTNTAYLQREVATRIKLKYAAKLKFLGDESFDEGSHIDRLLRDPKVARDLDQDD